MAVCELCGAPAEVRAIVEGVTLSVCGKCSKFGKVLIPPRGLKSVSGQSGSGGSFHTPSRRIVVSEPEEAVISEIASIVRSARERRSLTQKDFASMLGVKESLLQRVESGSSIPDLLTAKKWERVIGKKLVILIGADDFSSVSDREKNSGAMTIGDMMK